MKKIAILLLFIATTFPLYAQIITTVAGNGTIGHSGDGGAATAAALDGVVNSLILDTAGNIFFGEHIQVRRVDAVTGILTTVAGNGSSDYGGDGGPATDAAFNYPMALAFDRQGNFYIAHGDEDASGRYTYIRKISPSGIITTIAGGAAGYSGDGGPATAAQLHYVTCMIFDTVDNMFIADQFNNAIRKIDTHGIITTIAGDPTGAPGYTGDGGPASAAKFNFPTSILFDEKGELYISDYYSRAIRKVDNNGIINTVVADIPCFYITMDKKQNMYSTAMDGCVIRRINPGGVVTVYAGTGATDYNGRLYNGDNIPATAASLYFPEQIAVDDTGNLYIADTYHSRIRKVSANPLAVPLSALSVHGVKAYPNPSLGMVTFATGSVNHQPATITVTNILGQHITTLTTGKDGTAQWDSSSQPAGIYFYTTTTNGIATAGKLIIDK